jgi:hypothetical protein
MVERHMAKLRREFDGLRISALADIADIAATLR